LGSDRLYATIGHKKGWQIDDCFFVENRLNEIGSQIYGFYCPNRLSATLDGFFAPNKAKMPTLI